MNTRKTAVSSAIVAALNTSGNAVDPNNVPAKAPKAKAGEIVPHWDTAKGWIGLTGKRTDEAKVARTWHDKQVKAIGLLDESTSARQQDVMADLIGAAYNYIADRDLWRETNLGWQHVLAQHVAELHPSGIVKYEAYNNIVGALRESFGAHVATCYRDAVKAMHAFTFVGKRRPAWLGENWLPNKGDPRAKGGIKGYSPIKWHKGIASAMAKLGERVAKAPAGDIDADVLRKFNRAFAELVRLDAELGKRIAS